MNRIFRVLIVILCILILLGLSTGSAAQESTALPLSEPGPFAVGQRTMPLTDASRVTGATYFQLWYPALTKGKATAPDFSQAPYPVIVYSHSLPSGPAETGMAAHLASYGFVVIGPGHQNDYVKLWADRPLDILAALRTFQSLSVSEYAGLAELDRLGIAGLAMGGNNALQLCGARANQAIYEAFCLEHPNIIMCPTDTTLARDGWAYMAEQGVYDENDYWYIPSEFEFDAVASISAGFFPMFGEHGMALATVPALMIGGLRDNEFAYQDDQAQLFEYLGAGDKTFITFIEGGHDFVIANPKLNRQVQHFLVAFFGYHLQGRADFADYLGEDYVNGIEGLYWGVYTE